MVVAWRFGGRFSRATRAPVRRLLSCTRQSGPWNSPRYRQHRQRRMGAFAKRKRICDQRRRRTSIARFTTPATSCVPGSDLSWRSTTRIPRPSRSSSRTAASRSSRSTPAQRRGSRANRIHVRSRRHGASPTARGIAMTHQAEGVKGVDEMASGNGGVSTEVFDRLTALETENEQLRARRSKVESSSSKRRARSVSAAMSHLRRRSKCYAALRAASGSKFTSTRRKWSPTADVCPSRTRTDRLKGLMASTLPSALLHGRMAREAPAEVVTRA